MQRVRRATAIAVLPTDPVGGTPGYFAKPDTAGVPATVPGYEWYNNVQEELLAVIEGQSIAASGSDRTQLRQAIAKMIQSGQRAVIINNAVFAGAVTGTGKAVYWDFANSRFDLALADGTAKQNCVGFADVANANVYAFGDAVLFAGLTPGARYYLDGTTAGAITATAPTNTVFVGIAKSANEVFVDIDAIPLIGSGKIIASVFSSSRAVMAASGDTTAMTLNFTISQATPVVIDWRSWFGSLSASICYGNARIALGGVQKSRSSRIHLGISQAGYAYIFLFSGSTYLGVLAAGTYTVSLIWVGETAVQAIFNPGPGDTPGWAQADSEIIVRAAY